MTEMGNSAQETTSDHLGLPTLGKIGAWSGRLQHRPTSQAIDVVNELEELGYRSIWFPESPFGKDALTFSAVLLGASTTITVATGIAMVWARDPAAMTNAARTLGDAHPGRFLLGIGISHESSAVARGHNYQQPVDTMRRYLHDMHNTHFDGHGPEWTPPVVVAALGPRMLRLAAELSDGAHPFLATPEHTNKARETLGTDKLLAVEQGVIVGISEQAHAVARDNLSRYLAWPNYRRHFERLGFNEADFADGGSDRLINAVFVVGDEVAVQRRVQEHLDAGADHVCLQVVTPDMSEELNVYRRLAQAIPLK